MIDRTSPRAGWLYRFADHLVHSRHALSALTIAQAGAPVPSEKLLRIAQPAVVDELPVQTGWLHEWQDSNGDPTLQVAHLDGVADGLLLRVPGYCDFHLNPASGDVGIAVVAGTSPETLEHLLIDQALPRLLTQRGGLVLHASVVQIEGRTALFLGRSGWGKSTLAALLYQRGARLLSDDCAVLSVKDGAAWAIPTYPSLRLFEDSISRAFGPAPALTLVSEYSTKQRVGVTPNPTLVSAQVDVVYLLGDPASAPALIEITGLPPATACMALVEHNFQLDPTSPALTRALLRQAAAVIGATQAYSLQFPRSFDTADRLVDTLLSHLSASIPTNG